MFMSILNTISKLVATPIVKDFCLAIINFFTKGANKKAQTYAQKTTEQFAENLPTMVDELTVFLQKLQESTEPTAAALELAKAIFDPASPISQLLFSSKQAYECFNLLNQPHQASQAAEIACLNKVTP